MTIASTVFRIWRRVVQLKVTDFLPSTFCRLLAWLNFQPRRPRQYILSNVVNCLSKYPAPYTPLFAYASVIFSNWCLVKCITREIFVASCEPVCIDIISVKNKIYLPLSWDEPGRFMNGGQCGVKYYVIADTKGVFV